MMMAEDHHRYVPPRRTLYGLIVLGLVLTILALVPTYYQLGPAIDAWFDPVFLKIQAVGPRQFIPSSEFPARLCEERGWDRPGVCQPMPPEIVVLRGNAGNPTGEGTEFAWLVFKTDSLKVKRCRVADLSVRWLYDHQADAAVIYWDDKDEQFKPGTATLEGPLISRPLRVRIPQEAYVHPEVTLVWTFFYNCGKQWLIPAEFRVRVVLPTADPHDAYVDGSPLPSESGKLSSLARAVTLAQDGEP